MCQCEEEPTPAPAPFVCPHGTRCMSGSFGQAPACDPHQTCDYEGECCTEAGLHACLQGECMCQCEEEPTPAPAPFVCPHGTRCMSGSFGQGSPACDPHQTC